MAGGTPARQELRAFFTVYFVKSAATIDSAVDEFITETLKREFCGIIEERIREDDAKQDGVKCGGEGEVKVGVSI